MSGASSHNRGEGRRRNGHDERHQSSSGRDRGHDDARPRSQRPKRSRSRSRSQDRQSKQHTKKSRHRHLAGNLVIVCAGNDSLHEQCKWYGGSKDAVGARNYDLCVNYFGTDEGVADRFAQQLRAREDSVAAAAGGAAQTTRNKGNDRLFRYKGAKWVIVRQILAKHDFWRSYRYVWMPDDDLRVSDAPPLRILARARCLRTVRS